MNNGVIITLTYIYYYVFIRWSVMPAPRGRHMAQATGSRGDSSKTQVQVEPIPPEELSEDWRWSFEND